MWQTEPVGLDPAHITAEMGPSHPVRPPWYEGVGMRRTKRAVAAAFVIMATMGAGGCGSTATNSSSSTTANTGASATTAPATTQTTVATTTTIPVRRVVGTAKILGAGTFTGGSAVAAGLYSVTTAAGQSETLSYQVRIATTKFWEKTPPPVECLRCGFRSLRVTPSRSHR